MAGMTAKMSDAAAPTSPSKCSSMGRNLSDGSSDKICAKTQSRAPKAAAAGSAMTFLELPAEIRNIIYELAVKSDDGKTGHFQIRNHHAWLGPVVDGGYRKRHATQRPALLAVNRQVRSEAMFMFYAINSFAVTFSDFERPNKEYGETQSWLDLVGREQARMIKTFKVVFWCHNALDARRHICAFFTWKGRSSPEQASVRAIHVIDVLGLEVSGISPEAVQVEHDGFSEAETWYRIL